MRLIFSNDVKNFLKNSILTEQDLINKMNELFTEYPKVYTFISAEIVKNNKVFNVDYATSDNMRDIECVYVHEANINPDAMTVKEYYEKIKKKKQQDKIQHLNCTLKRRVFFMRLILIPEVKQFLKINKILTKKDIENKMYEEFPFPPQKPLVLSTSIEKKRQKVFCIVRNKR
jgi:hypothetical protein